MLQLMICDDMGWTYDEYMSNPPWYLDVLKDRIILRAQTKPKEGNKSDDK